MTFFFALHLPLGRKIGHLRTCSPFFALHATLGEKRTASHCAPSSFKFLGTPLEGYGKAKQQGYDFVP